MKKRDFLKTLAVPTLALAAMKVNALEKITAPFRKSPRMPVLFIGHGHPMNALYDNDFTKRLKTIGQEIERPNAIMVVSAHWETQGTYVSVNPAPKTIYDFGRFDDRLFQIKYEPQGHPVLAKSVIQTAADYLIQEDTQMGLDHGAWTVLKFIFPEQNIPVFQLSIDYTKPPSYHFQLATALKKMREKGMLILGSGNIVHNLQHLDWHDIAAKPHDWALEFDTLVKQKLEQRAFGDLINYQRLGMAAQLSIPTNDHYLPMLYSLGLMDKKDRIEQLYEGYQYAGISMRCFKIS